MKSWFKAAAFFVAAASAFTAPPAVNPADVDIDGRTVAGSIVPDGTSVYFSVPCPECFVDSNEELDIELKLDSSSLACQVSEIVVNNVRLSASEPSILFKANTTHAADSHDVMASWEMSCLRHEVTLLSLHITEILGSIKIRQGSGFSISFTQTGVPRVLRMENKPAQHTRLARISALWSTPQTDQAFTAVSSPTAIDEQLPTELQAQLRRLHEIKAQIGRLHQKYMRQEHRIFQMIRQEFDTCSGTRCLVQTAIKQAPDFFELVKAHFKHRPDWSKLHGHKSSDFESFINTAVDENGIRKQGDARIHYDVDEGDLPYPPPFDADVPEDSHPPPPKHGDHGPPPHPHHHGEHPPPPPPPPPPHHHNETRTPPPPHHDGHPSRPPPDHHHHHHPPPWVKHPGPGHHKPHFVHRHGPHRHPFVFSFGSILLFVVVASLLFKCVRAKTGLFRDARRKRDHEATREECRTRAAYRRAAIQHRWRRWWSQFRHPESTADYEEKRARLLGQEDVLEDVMQSEIRDLRRAHELVGELMRAEEGRQRSYHDANFGGSAQPGGSASYMLQRQNTESGPSMDSTLPVYAPPPPSYDQELEGEIMVADGFSYTPSATGSTPGSSVVDCDPRMSFETSTTVMK